MNHFLLVRVAAAYELYTEELLLRPLRGDRTAAHFSFTIEDTFPTNGARSAHYHLIPRVFGEIVRRGAVRELEFSVPPGTSLRSPAAQRGPGRRVAMGMDRCCESFERRGARRWR